MRLGWRLFGFCGVLAAVLAFTPADVMGQKKKDKKKAADLSNPAAPEDYKKIQTIKELTGNIVEIDGASKTVTLRVKWSHMEPNPNYKPPKVPNTNYAQQLQMMNTYNNLMRQQQLALSATTPAQQQKAIAKFNQDMARFQQQYGMQMAKMATAYAKVDPTNPNSQPFRSVEDPPIDYTLEVEDAIPIRKMFLPLEYDDTGNIKKYTDKEKEELRGKDKKKPGYEAKLEEVMPGQEVKLTLTAPKIKKKEKSNTGSKDKDKDKDADPEENVVERPTVHMLVMTKEMTMTSSADPAPRKGKK